LEKLWRIKGIFFEFYKKIINRRPKTTSKTCSYIKILLVSLLILEV